MHEEEKSDDEHERFISKSSDLYVGHPWNWWEDRLDPHPYLSVRPVIVSTQNGLKVWTDSKCSDK